MLTVTQWKNCEEEERVQPLSRATLFRILEVREASQQKSLSGLDNTAADGSTGFVRMEKIVDGLKQIGQEKGWSEDIKQSLQSSKRYLKTEYRDHCHEGDSTCPDHRSKYALSDPYDPDLQGKCQHDHNSSCRQCDDIAFSLLFTVNSNEKTSFMISTGLLRPSIIGKHIS